jgi:hypothetical protein
MAQGRGLGGVSEGSQGGGRSWVGAGTGDRKDSGFPSRAQAVAREAGVRQGPSSSWARAMRRAKRLRSRASCSQGPRRAACAGPAQTASKWTVTFSEKRTWEQTGRHTMEIQTDAQGQRDPDSKGGGREKQRNTSGTKMLAIWLVTCLAWGPADSLMLEMVSWGCPLPQLSPPPTGAQPLTEDYYSVHSPPSRVPMQPFATTGIQEFCHPAISPTHP